MNLDRFGARRMDVLGPWGVATRETLAREARSLAPSLRTLGGPGSVVEVPAPDAKTALVFLEAAWEAGKVPLPRAKASAPTLAGLVPVPNAALVLRTSGSTGEPKNVAFDWVALVRSAQKIAACMEWTEATRVGIVQSLEHGYGLVGQLFAAIAAHATVVHCGAPYVDEQVAALRAGRVTALSAVPFTWGKLVEAGLGGGALECLGSAGGPLSAPLAARLRAAFPAAALWNQYGCTEAGPRLTAIRREDSHFEAGSVGRPLEGVEVIVASDRRVGFRGDTMALGYVEPEGLLPLPTLEAWGFPGYVPSGDLGRLDAEGYLYVEGRCDEVVKVRGMKVALVQVAAAAEKLGARAALAVAVPSTGAEGGATSTDPAIVLVYEGPTALSRFEFSKILPLEAWPTRLLRVDSIPRLSSGKPNRREALRIAQGAP